MAFKTGTKCISYKQFQIMSCICETLILYSVFFAIPLIWRFLKEPLGPIMASIMVCSRGYCGNVVLIYMIESLIIRYLSIIWWKRLPPINDVFFGVFFRVTNSVLGLCMTGFSTFTFGYSNMVLRYTGKVPIPLGPNLLRVK
jgi:hypothetical protein